MLFQLISKYSQIYYALYWRIFTCLSENISFHDPNYLLLNSNSKAANFNTGRRFKSPIPKLQNPGPGTYEAVGNVSNGNQSCSNYHSIITRTFKTTEDQRPTEIQRFKTPGPGTYRPPSDFGYMDSLISPKDNESILESQF